MITDVTQGWTGHKENQNNSHYAAMWVGTERLATSNAVQYKMNEESSGQNEYWSRHVNGLLHSQCVNIEQKSQKHSQAHKTMIEI